MAISYLNGTWQPVEEARVSVLDRGFLFGDGIYEVVPVYNGNAFCLDRHLTRLFNSAREIRLTMPCEAPALKSLIVEGLEKAGETYASIYVQIKRGADVRRDFI